MNKEHICPKFRLPFSKLSDLSGEESLDEIKSSNKIILNKLNLFDLVLENEVPTKLWHGVYVFFSEKDIPLYVGKNSSQTFIERIPWHFALHEKSWMNHFLKKARNSDFQNRTLSETLLKILNCKLLLIPSNQYNLISVFEKYLRIFLEPKYNAYSLNYRNKYRNIDLSKNLNDILINNIK